MRVIFKGIYGSKLYDADLPDSDDDFMGVFMPSLYDLHSLEKPLDSVNLNEKVTEGKKNSKGDIDYTIFSLRYFFNMALGGKTTAVEMLLTPDEKIVTNSEIWREVRYYRDVFYSKKMLNPIFSAVKSCLRNPDKKNSFYHAARLLLLADHLIENELDSFFPLSYEAVKELKAAKISCDPRKSAEYYEKIKILEHKALSIRESPDHSDAELVYRRVMRLGMNVEKKEKKMENQTENLTPEQKKKLKHWHYHAPNEDQIARLQRINDATREVAELVMRLTVEGRNQSIALKSLEDARMRANAAIVVEEAMLEDAES